MASEGSEENQVVAAEAKALAADGEDVREAVTVRNLMGSVRFLVSDEELMKPLYEDWEADPID